MVRDPSFRRLGREMDNHRYFAVKSLEMRPIRESKPAISNNPIPMPNLGDSAWVRNRRTRVFCAANRKTRPKQVQLASPSRKKYYKKPSQVEQTSGAYQNVTWYPV